MEPGDTAGAVASTPPLESFQSRALCTLRPRDAGITHPGRTLSRAWGLSARKSAPPLGT